MIAGLAMQLTSAALCAVAAGLNLQQAIKWQRCRRELRAQLRPVAKVILRDDSERQLGIMGALPEPGTVLYVMDAPRAKAPAQKVMHA